MLMGVSLGVVKYYYPDDNYIMDVMVAYLYPTFEFIFIVVAVIAYSLLFHKYRKSRIPPVKIAPGQSGLRKLPSVHKVFLTSRFYVAVLLIATFLVFVTTADLMYSFGVATGYNKPGMVNELLRLSIAFGCLCDALIYIFMNTHVKRLLYKKLPSTCLSRRRDDNRVGIAI